MDTEQDGRRGWTIPIATESVADCHELARCLELAARDGGHVPRELVPLAAQLSAEAEAAAAHVELLASLSAAQQDQLTTRIARLCAGLMRHGSRGAALPQRP